MLLLERLEIAAFDAWCEYATRKNVRRKGVPNEARNEHRLGYYHGLRDAYFMAGGSSITLSDRIEAWEATR